MQSQRERAVSVLAHIEDNVVGTRREWVGAHRLDRLYIFLHIHVLSTLHSSANLLVFNEERTGMQSTPLVNSKAQK